MIEERWKITHIDVPFRSMLFWMLKFLGCYLLLASVMTAIILTIMGILGLVSAAAVGAAASAVHSKQPRNFSDPNYWKK